MLSNIIRNRKKTGIGGGGGGAVIDGGDPYYSAVSLMLSMDGTNGSTTFTDSSLNALTVTSSGVAISDTAARSGFGQFGDFSGSSSSALTIAASSVFNFGTGDFTIEFWFNIPAGASGSPYGKTFVSNENNVWSAGAFSLYALASATQFRPSFWINEFSASVPILLPTSGDYRDGNWHHLAVVRRGSAFSMYIDGTLAASGTHSGNCGSSSRNLMIGDNLANNGGDRNFLGKLDDLRISQFARYVSTFTPPTAALPTTASSTVADPYYNYTSLLLHMDGTNASTSFVDSGPSALTVTAVANAQISTTQSKFGAASGYFDGTGDSLTIPANTALALGAGDYTIEGWFYSLTSGTSLRGMIDFRTAATGTNGLMLRENDGGFLVYINNATLLSTTTGRVANQWQHVALVRKGTTVTLYVDGVSLTTATSSTTLTDNILRISGFVDTQSSVYTYNGYMDEIRVTKYARAITAAPTAAFPNIYNQYATLPVSGAALWLAGDDSSTLYTDAGSSAVTKSGDLVYQWSDKSGNGRNATQATSGNRPTWVAPANARNTLGAVGFNGSQWIDLADGTAIAFGTGDFTIEGWVKPAAYSGNSSLLGCGNNGLILFFSSTGLLKAGYYGTGTTLSSVSTLTVGTWYHIAVTRSGTTLRIFINGVLNASTTASDNYTGNQVVRIGWDPTPANGNIKYNGQVQNLIIYKGQALYTANFTPFMS